jgi:hypothetical protein
MDELEHLTPETTAPLRRLQCLDDAIAYRSARLAAPCDLCAAGGRCPGHAVDEQLIADYRRRQAGALREVVARCDPADVTTVMTGSEETPPIGLATAIAMAARLRELAASGPFITTRGEDSVVITLEEGRLLEHPLTDPAWPRSPAPG